MGNDWVNIRFGSWHLQVLRDRPYLHFGRNPYHDDARWFDPDWSWFKVYTFLGYRADL